MKKITKNILLALGLSTATIYSYNRFIENTATKNDLLGKDNGLFYAWKNGNIFYTKTGTGSPLLLVHDAVASASGAEWKKIIHRLEKNHTVYCIDLLGCGRSEKPAIEYTNYIYVQMLTSFVKDVIQEKTTVVATHMSASFAIMANHMDDTLFEKMILINPVSLKQLSIIPDEVSKVKKTIIELPFIGTFIYNRMNSYQQIDKTFRNNYYSRSQFVSSNIEDIYYEAAHTSGGNGKYLYSSTLGNYLNNNINHAVKDITIPTLIIGSKEIKNNELNLDDYHRLNSTINISRITHGNLYPHMELPEKIAIMIENYLTK